MLTSARIVAIQNPRFEPRVQGQGAVFLALVIGQLVVDALFQVDAFEIRHGDRLRVGGACVQNVQRTGESAHAGQVKILK